MSSLAALSSVATGLLRPASERTLLQAPVLVRPDFLGMHLHRWPQGDPVSPVPSYGYGAVRSHDYSVILNVMWWSEIYTRDGFFDWSQMDPWVSAHQAKGRTLTYTVYGTPEWLTSSSANQDAYGRAGAANPPRALEPLSQFITALVRRYNSPGSRAISFVEIWNEPHFAHSYADFWWGSAVELASMARAIYLAAKAADAGILVLSPGFDGNLTDTLSLRNSTLAAAEGSSLYQYLSASDGAGGRGSQWCDGIAFHTYEARIAGATDGIEGELLLLRKMLALMQLSLPVYCTECGFRPESAFAKSSVVDQATMLRRLAVILAASHVRGVYFYAHDDDFIGNPSIHPEISLALDQLQTNLAGRTLRQVTVRADSSLRVETDHESLLW